MPHRIRVSALAVIAFMTTVASQALAAPRPSCVGSIEVSNAKVLRAEQNGVLVIADGRAVKLEGLRLPQGEADKAPKFLAGQAVAMLNDLVRGRHVSLAVHRPKQDRYGRLRAQVFLAADAHEPWLQIAMLERGLARVDIASDRPECAKALYAAEQRARTNHYGIWALDAYAVRGPETVGPYTGTFQIVEGDVIDAVVKGGRAYLNFGADWRTDFTAMIRPEDMATFRAAHVDPRDFKGHRVRLRGMVQNYNGPEIEIAAPDDIEIIKDAPGPPLRSSTLP